MIAERKGVMMMTMMSDNGGGVLDDDMSEGMQCSDHPYKNNPGGICAFCLQEKLGKLVSSSKYNPSLFPILPSSSSSSPSFRSEGGGRLGGGTSSTSLVVSHPTASSSSSYNGNSMYNGQCHYSNRTRIPFLPAQKKKKVRTVVSSSDSNSLVLKRSKSAAASRRGQLLDVDVNEYSPRKKGFWSFLYVSTWRRSSSSRWDNGDRDTKHCIHPTTTSTTTASSSSSSQTVKGKIGESSRKMDVAADENESPSGSHASSSSFGRKVARSRSVGCGSRSFSGDFLERISTGFGDCTLRRVESQREAKPKAALHRAAGDMEEHDRIKERVKCGGLFGGFSMTSSSYWLSSTSSAEDINGRISASASGMGPLAHGRSKSWGWAFASPMSAFSRPSSKPDDRDGKKDVVEVQKPPSSTNGNPNLSAIPSFMAVRG